MKPVQIKIQFSVGRLNQLNGNIYLDWTMDSSEKLFAAISISPFLGTMKPIVRLRCILTGILLFTLELATMISSGIYFFKLVHDDLENSLYALLQFAAFVCGTYTIAMGYMQRRCIIMLFPKFSQIRYECQSLVADHPILVSWI